MAKVNKDNLQYDNLMLYMKMFPSDVGVIVFMHPAKHDYGVEEHAVDALGADAFKPQRFSVETYVYARLYLAMDVNVSMSHI